MKDEGGACRGGLVGLGGAASHRGGDAHACTKANVDKVIAPRRIDLFIGYRR